MGWIPSTQLGRGELGEGTRICIVTPEISCVLTVIQRSDKAVVFRPAADHPFAKKFTSLILKGKSLKQGGRAVLHERERGGEKIMLMNILSLSLLPVIVSSTINASF